MDNHWFTEFERHLMQDTAPSVYFNGLIDEKRFPTAFPFSLLYDLTGVAQSPMHHPEGNAWEHTMQVVDNAAQRRQRSRDPRALMWAALLHDLGKIPATRKKDGRITAYDHDKAGEGLARRFLEACGQDKAFTAQVSALVRWHMQLFYVQKNLPFADLERMVMQADAHEVALLSLCDRLGRNNNTPQEAEREEKNMRMFLEKCSAISGG